MLSFLLAITASLPKTPEHRNDKRIRTGKRPRAELLKPYRELNDYTVRIKTRVNIPGFRAAEFSILVYYKKPGKFHIEAKGFAPLPRNGVLFNPFQ